MSVLYAIYSTEQPPALPVNISPELQDFIQSCLKMKPQERANVYQLLRHPFITGDYQQPKVKPGLNEFDFKRFYSEDRPNKYLII
jgi:serine/threonine protein kinase